MTKLFQLPKKKYCYNGSIIYREHTIPSHPVIFLRVSRSVMKRIIDAKIDTGLSVREVLEYSGKPCECCKDINVTVYNKQNNSVQIKRGILNKK